jgi:hypothetical protein
MPHDYRPLIAAKGELPPQRGYGGSALGQRDADDRQRKSGGGNEDDDQKRGEHVHDPRCDFRLRGRLWEKPASESLFPVCLTECGLCSLFVLSSRSISRQSESPARRIALDLGTVKR